VNDRTQDATNWTTTIIIMIIIIIIIIIQATTGIIINAYSLELSN